MTVLIIGGSGSGKSAWAERYAVSLARGSKKYYIATMQAADEEGIKRVERHRKLRRGKGFDTIEQPAAVQNALSRMEAGEKTALLECISNLLANEMFPEDGIRTGEEAEQTVMEGIRTLRDGLSHLVIVSNNVFEDGTVYDETTMDYIRAMGRINQGLAALADRVIEVVVGIPMSLKGGEPVLLPEEEEGEGICVY